jgi:hypothetical protein
MPDEAGGVEAGRGRTGGRRNAARIHFTLGR